MFLLPDIQREPPEPEPHECAIAITSVVGVGWPEPETIKVTGTASGCDQVVVTVAGPGAGSASVQVAVDAGGRWAAELAHIPEIECGRPATVRAACAKDPHCNDLKEVDRLECVPTPTPG